MRQLALSLAAFSICAALSLGCATEYVTPGRAANLAAVDRSDIRTELAREPAASFPARLAIVRVQAREYRSYSQTGGGIAAGGFEVLTVQELLSDVQLKSIEAWREVAGVAPVNRLLLPEHMNGLDDLRLAAAKVQADVLLLYTLDTRFQVRRKSVLPTGVISLGIAPDRDAHVVSTASALFIDVRTGFVYGLSEATASEQGLASFWSSQEQIDQKRIAAEQRAFDDLITASAETWRGIARKHAASPRAEPSDPPQLVSDIL